MLQVSSTKEWSLSMADGLHQSFGSLCYLLHLHVIQETTLFLIGYTWEEWVTNTHVYVFFFLQLMCDSLKSGALLTNMCLLCLVDFGMIENSLLSFIAIFLPAISSYMADKYSSGRSLLSLIPRFILMYCSFVILFFTYINRKQGRNLVEHIFNCGYKMCFLSIEKTGTK